MHFTTLLAIMVTHGLILPPVQTYKGEVLKAANPEEAVKEFVKKHHPNPSFIEGPTNPGAMPWSDNGRFPCKEKLNWYEAVLGEKSWNLWNARKYYPSLIVIDCRTEELAKNCFLECRTWRLPDYARSGRFLIKANQKSLMWFTQHYGAEAYFIHRPDWFWEWATQRR